MKIAISMLALIIATLMSNTSYASTCAGECGCPDDLGAGPCSYSWECIGSPCSLTLPNAEQLGGYLSFGQYLCAVSGFEGGFTSASSSIYLVPNYDSNGYYTVLGYGSSTYHPTLDIYCVPYEWFSPGVTTTYGDWSLDVKAGYGSDRNLIAISDNFCYFMGLQGQLSGTEIRGAPSFGYVSTESSDYILVAEATGTTNIQDFASCVQFSGHHTTAYYATVAGSNVVLPPLSQAFCAVTNVQGPWDYTTSQGQAWGGIVISGNTQTLEVSSASSNTLIGVTCINYDN